MKRSFPRQIRSRYKLIFSGPKFSPSGGDKITYYLCAREKTGRCLTVLRIEHDFGTVVRWNPCILISMKKAMGRHDRTNLRGMRFLPLTHEFPYKIHFRMAYGSPSVWAVRTFHFLLLYSSQSSSLEYSVLSAKRFLFCYIWGSIFCIYCYCCLLLRLLALRCVAVENGIFG